MYNLKPNVGSHLKLMNRTKDLKTDGRYKENFWRASIIIIFVALIFAGYMISVYWLGNLEITPLKAEKGILHISERDFKTKKAFALNGQWEFYWNQLIKPADFRMGSVRKAGSYINFPSQWTSQSLKHPNEGYGTYRLLLKFDQPPKNPVIQAKMFISSCNMYVNGDLVYESGTVGKTRSTTYGRFKPDMVFLNNIGRENEIILHISNFDFANGGLAASLIFGDATHLTTEIEKRTFFDAFLFGSILFMGLYHLILYMLRKKEYSLLYFSMICFLVAIRTLLMDEMLLYKFVGDLSLVFFLKISMLTLSLSIVLFVMFINEIFPDETPRWFTGFSQIVGLIYSAITIILPDKLNDYFLVPYEIASIFIFISLIAITFKSVTKKREGSVIIFTAVFVIFIIIANDVLNQLGLIKTAFFIPVGLFVFLFVQSFMLSKKFADSFRRVEVLSNRLLSLDRLKDEFLANTTHELKTPLNGIIGIAQSMMDGDFGELNEVGRNNISLIETSGKRLNSLIDDILDYSKIKNKEFTLNRKPMELRHVSETVMALMKPLAAVKSLEFINEIGVSMPLVFADENRLEQILINLIGNATKFTEKGFVRLYANEKDGFVYISVEDSGIGVPKDKRESIFNSFKQADNSISREYGGTGLGLSISKKLVELHGGFIQLESVVGEGSVFTFTLPVSEELVVDKVRDTEIQANITVPPMEAKPFLPDIKSADSERLKILIVDDDPINLQVLYNFLTYQSFDVTIAVNGKEAIDIVSNTDRSRFSIMIVDVMMPEISGYEVCKTVRCNYSVAELPILVLTAKSRKNDIVMGFESGANDYLEKPFDKYELIARVNSLIALKKTVEQEARLLRTELRTLQAQIRPHFLFNSLNTIVSFIRISPDMARELLIELSNYLRNGFAYKDDEEFIEFEKELSHIKSYLSLEKARFSERLNVVYDIAGTIKSRIPPLIFEPLVENAVKHGLLPKDDGGTVVIKAREVGGELTMEVEDDGIGMPEEKVLALINGYNESEGIGIENIHKRLQKIYGRKLSIKSTPGGGTKISINIPCNQGGTK